VELIFAGQSSGGVWRWTVVIMGFGYDLHSNNPLEATCLCYDTGKKLWFLFQGTTGELFLCQASKLVLAEYFGPLLELSCTRATSLRWAAVTSAARCPQLLQAHRKACSFSGIMHRLQICGGIPSAIFLL